MFRTCNRFVETSALSLRNIKSSAATGKYHNKYHNNYDIVLSRVLLAKP